MDGLASTEFASDDEIGWAERCSYWLTEADNAKPKRLRREREAKPLVLCGHGVSLRVDKGRLCIRHGNTHFPAERREHQFFKGDLALPPRIVMVDGSGSISFDVLDWLGDQGVPLIRLRWDGSVSAVMSPTGFAADPDKVAWQRATVDDPQARLAFASKIIADKLRATVITLAEAIPASKRRDNAVATTERALTSIESGEPRSLPDLLGVEGKAATAYFLAWRDFPLKWRATKRHPIPDEWRSFHARASLAERKPKNRRATHPLNAMLNYAYTVTQAQVQIQAIADGFDPTLGILHTPSAGRPSYALDLIEPLRPVVDSAILRFVSEHTFTGADFLLQADGVCRLNPELGRRIAQSERPRE